MSGSALKLIMMFLMILDHIDYFIPEKLFIVFHLITRCVAPFFSYMVVEGFIHTRSRPKYVARLLVAAGIMYAGNALLNYFFLHDTRFMVNNNVFSTLAACAFCLWCFSEILKDKKVYLNALIGLAGTLIALFAIFMLEWGYVLIPLALITYYCRGKGWRRNILYVVLSITVFFLFDYQRYPTVQETLYHLAFRSQFLFITFLPFIYLYNGKRGSGGALTKYVFYIFYPLHIWIIHVIAWLTQRV